MKYSKKFVMRVNEIYHDIDAKYYEKKHPEIFKAEYQRWKRNFSFIIKKIKGRKIIMDFGTGTGFVPLSIGQYLKENDTFICSDISKNMLNISEKKLREKNFKCKFKFVKIKNQKIPWGDNSVDILTLNSVLHHLPDVSLLFKEAYRVLKLGGYLAIGHEPNNLFYNSFLWTNYKICSRLFRPQSIVLDIVKKLGLYEKIRKLLQKFYKNLKKENETLDNVNKELVKRGLISKSLPYSEIIKIVDIQSPSAGSMEKSKGFNIPNLVKEYSNQFKLVKCETYNHLLGISSKNKFLRAYNSSLKKKFPEKGATLFFVLQKK